MAYIPDTNSVTRLMRSGSLNVAVGTIASALESPCPRAFIACFTSLKVSAPSPLVSNLRNRRHRVSRTLMFNHRK